MTSKSESYSEYELEHVHTRETLVDLDLEYYLLEFQRKALAISQEVMNGTISTDYIKEKARAILSGCNQLDKDVKILTERKEQRERRKRKEVIK